jgi:hypothetical protein
MDERKFLFTGPTFYLPLSLGSSVFIWVFFGIQKIGIMLFHSVSKVGCDSSVKLAATIADVNVPHDELSNRKALPKRIRQGLIGLAPQHGLEPRTQWLTATCSAN